MFEDLDLAAKAVCAISSVISKIEVWRVLEFLQKCIFCVKFRHIHRKIYRYY